MLAQSAGIDAKTFNWLDKPDNNLLHNTVQQLVWLEALEIQDGQTVLTDFGRLVIELQVLTDLLSLQPFFASLLYYCYINT